MQDDSETEAADDRSDSEEDSDTSGGEALEEAPETPRAKETQTKLEEKPKTVVAVETLPTEVQPECGNEKVPLVSDKFGSTHDLSKDTWPAEISKESQKASSNFVGIL